jgi:HEAT repeat protein
VKRQIAFVIVGCALACAAGTASLRPRSEPPSSVASPAATAVGDVQRLAEVAASDSERAERAAAAIGQTADPRAVPALRELLAGPNAPIVRANAARALGRSGSPADTAFLCAWLRRGDEVARVRTEAALAIGVIADPSAVSSLVETLRNEATNDEPNAEQLRTAIVQALGAIGGDEAHAALEEHARRNLSTTERAFTRRSLAMPARRRPG